jgi:hypothetical protein
LRNLIVCWRGEPCPTALSITLALAQPALMPQSTVTVLGFKPQIDSAAWLVKSVEHSLGEGGFTTSVELEGQGGGEISARPESHDKGQGKNPVWNGGGATGGWEPNTGGATGGW